MEQTRVAQQAFRGKSDGNKFLHIRILLCGIDLLQLLLLLFNYLITTDFYIPVLLVDTAAKENCCQEPATLGLAWMFPFFNQEG